MCIQHTAYIYTYAYAYTYAYTYIVPVHVHTAHSMLRDVVGERGETDRRMHGRRQVALRSAFDAYTYVHAGQPAGANPDPNPNPKPNTNPNPNQDGQLEAPLQLYAALAEGGYEVAQSNVAFLLDQHVTHKPDEPLLGMQPEQVAARAADMYRRAAQQVRAPLRPCTHPLHTRCTRCTRCTLCTLCALRPFRPSATRRHPPT